jgi:pimeloyl-ACP methyl ester carboxylesterase
VDFHLEAAIVRLRQNRVRKGFMLNFHQMAYRLLSQSPGVVKTYATTFAACCSCSRIAEMPVANRLKTLLSGLILIFTLTATAIPAQERITLQSGDLTLNGRLVLAAGQSLSDGVVLLTHGTLAHNAMETIQGLQGVFEDRGISSLAITLSLGISDRRGFYDCAVPSRHLHQDAVAEISLWTGWLQAQGARDITLMGHSRGGNQTAWFAAENGDAGFSRVILLAPMLADPVTDALAYETRYGRPLAEVLQGAQDKVTAGRGDELMQVPGLLFCRNAQASAATFMSYYAPEPRRDTASLLAAIRQPVLVIGGTADTVVPDLDVAIAPLADAENITLVMIADADHSFLDFSAEDVADAVEEFLAD